LLRHDLASIACAKLIAKLAIEEMAFLDGETKIRRKASLKEFYTQQEEM